MGVSKNRGTPKWIVYDVQSLLKWMISVYHDFWKHPCSCIVCTNFTKKNRWYFPSFMDFVYPIRFGDMILFEHMFQLPAVAVYIKTTTATTTRNNNNNKANNWVKILSWLCSIFNHEVLASSTIGSTFEDGW